MGGVAGARRRITRVAADRYDCPDIRESIMQRRGIAGVILCTVALAIAGFAVSAPAQGKIRLAQSSVTTTCMMTCNGQYANCQSSCLTIGTQQQFSPSGTILGANANPNQTCLASCTNQQLQCQIICARSSPSR
jgi:hypothetical protein